MTTFDFRVLVHTQKIITFKVTCPQSSVRYCTQVHWTQVTFYKVLETHGLVKMVTLYLRDDTVPDLYAGHPAAEVGGGVAIGHVGDQLQPQLPGVQDLLEVRVLGIFLHGLFDHDPGVEDILQHVWQHSLPY